MYSENKESFISITKKDGCGLLQGESSCINIAPLELLPRVEDRGKKSWGVVHASARVLAKEKYDSCKVLVARPL